MTKKKSAVVVPIYNSALWVVHCVRHLLKNTDEETDIFLQNDCSPDISIRDLLTDFEGIERVSIGHNSENLGFLGTCNKVFTQIRDSYDYVFLCNSDVLVTPSAIEKGAAFFDRHEDLGLVSYLATFGANLTLMLPVGTDYLEMDRYLSENPIREDARAVTCVGHLLGIRTDAVDEELLFDPLFGRGYGEESDLHFRMRRKGLRSGVCPDSFVYHRGEASFGSDHQKENIELFWSRWGEDYNSEMKLEKKGYTLGDVRSFKSWHPPRKVSKRIDTLRTSCPPKVRLFCIDLIDMEFMDEVCYEILNFQQDVDEVLILVNVGRYEGRNLPCKVYDLKTVKKLNQYLHSGCGDIEVHYSKPNLKGMMKSYLSTALEGHTVEEGREDVMGFLYHKPEYLDAYRAHHGLHMDT